MTSKQCTEVPWPADEILWISVNSRSYIITTNSRSKSSIFRILLACWLTITYLSLNVWISFQSVEGHQCEACGCNTDDCNRASTSPSSSTPPTSTTPASGSTCLESGTAVLLGMLFSCYIQRFLEIFWRHDTFLK